ncbi:unnamed protein product [Leptidea sinapis]|uniref:Lipocalin/cytosolic fatty-acid binding domain-containing protein n=1 Tax=Leptidea sinapis TaxID=189913 RepID=A0A5E4QBE7_9NEOP|nr:unnamed protein product [Leptidea sinapis]
MLVILLIHFLIQSVFCVSITPEACEGYRGGFDTKKNVGVWYVVAIIPDGNFTKNFDTLPCYRVDFSEVDEAALMWMIERKFGKIADEIMDKSPGDVLRQRYHTENPFDIWSKSVLKVSGCYRQLVDLRNNETDISGAKQHNSPMLLHHLQLEEGDFLLQLLWGRISTVVYKREPEITMNELAAVVEFLSMYRGPMQQPKICSPKLKIYSSTPSTLTDDDLQ